MLYKKEQVAGIFKEKFAFIKIEEKDNTFTITLNRPEKRNAIHELFTNEIFFALSYAHYNNKVWAVVLKAKGPTFCAGADLKAAFSKDNLDAEGSTIPLPRKKYVIGNELKGLHKPLIAQVHADMYAGAFLLICGCTHVVAANTIKLGLPEVKRGIFPMQVMASLMPIMNSRKMLDLCMRGKSISAKEAYDLNIITDLADPEDLEAKVNEIVSELKEQSPTAIKAGLKAYHELGGIVPEYQHEYLFGMLKKLLETADAKEGIAAFNEKRKANWTGE